jgi:hypothetical protein
MTEAYIPFLGEQGERDKSDDQFTRKCCNFPQGKGKTVKCFNKNEKPIAYTY